MRGRGSVFGGLLAQCRSRGITAVKPGQTELEKKTVKIEKKSQKKPKKTKKKEVKECMQIVQIGECVQTLNIVKGSPLFETVPSGSVFKP